MNTESGNGKGWIMYVMVLGIGTLLFMVSQSDGGIYELGAAIGSGVMMLCVGAFFFFMERRYEKFNPIEEEKRLKKSDNITLQKICIYMDSKILLILWNILIGMSIVVAVIICILALTEYHQYLKIGTGVLVTEIVADVIINILLIKFYYGRKDYRKIIIKNTSTYIGVDEKYTYILEDVLKHELVYRSHRLIITDSLIMSDYTALPFSWMSEIYLDKMLPFSRSPIYLVCKLKNGKKATFCVASGYAERYIKKVWEYQNIERFLDNDYYEHRFEIF